MKEWVMDFIRSDGQRIFYMGVATVFGLGLFYIGRRVGNNELAGSGIGMLIGVGTYALNRARGNAKKPGGEG